MQASEKRSITKQFWLLVQPYWSGDKKRQAWTLLAIAIFFILLLSGINAFKTYTTKWAVNALTDRNIHEFYRTITIAVFALLISIPIVALQEYSIDKLGVFWRNWLNLSFLKRYFANKTFYKISLYSDIDNPDQRIAEDLFNFTQNSVTLFGKVGFSIISILTFIGVLWSISPTLVLAVVLYALVGNLIIIFLMKKLVRLNFRNYRFQADYRYNLVHVRDNLESIAFYQGEKHENTVLKSAFRTLINNYILLIKTKRNITFAAQAYTLLSALCPFLILAPGVFKGKVEIGVVVQAVTVFAIVLTDFSVIIEQFPLISQLGANIQRLGGFAEAFHVKPPEAETFDYQQGKTFHFKNITVQTPDLSKTLVKNLSLEIKPGTSLMIMGASGCGKSSMLRSIAGLWKTGSGHITCPDRKDVMFLPQKPYMLIGSLKDQLVYPKLDSTYQDQPLIDALAEVNLADLVERIGGLNTVMKWADLLSLGEQQRLIFVRLFLMKPKFAILDESSSALDEDNEAIVYNKLKESGITYISVGHRSSLLKFHDYVLRMLDNHQWTLLPRDEYLAQYGNSH